MDGALHGDFGARLIASEVDGEAERRAADARVRRVYEQERELLEHLAAGGAAAGSRHGFRGAARAVARLIFVSGQNTLAVILNNRRADGVPGFEIRDL